MNSQLLPMGHGVAHQEAVLEPLRLLILGGGAVTLELHGPGVSLLGWWRGTTIIEPSAATAAELRRLFPEATIVDEDFEAFLKADGLRDRFDGVVVALPNHLHEKAASLALKAGLPVLCEKPLALDVFSCRRLGALSTARGVPLTVAMVRRLTPWAGTFREFLRAGLIGDVQSVRIVHGDRFAWPVKSDIYFSRRHGGLLVNMGVHYLDMIEDWIGPLTVADYCDDFGGGAEANFDLRLRTARGAPVQLKLSITHALDNTVEIVGSNGTLSADPNRFDRCFWSPKGIGAKADLAPQRPFRSGDWPLAFVSCFAEQLYEFREVIKGIASPRVDACAAAATQEIIDAAYASRRRIGAVFASADERRPALSPGKVVVTGGTGFVGGRLVERLTQIASDDVSVIMRAVMTSANVSRFPAERIVADLLDADAMRTALRGARYAFHLAFGASGTDLDKVTIDGTRVFLDAAIEAGVECVVVVSTASVFGHPPGGGVVDESAPYAPGLGDYGRSKAKSEQIALSRAKASKTTRIVVINPTAVYGPLSPLFVELPARKTIEGTFGWIDDGCGKINYVHVDNLVDALLLAATTSAAHGERFIVNDGVTTFRKFLTPLLGGRAAGLGSYTREELLSHETRNRATLYDLARAVTDDEVMRVLNDLPLFARCKKFVTSRMPNHYAKVQRGRKALQVASPAKREALVPPSWLADIFGPFETMFSSAKAQRVLGWRPAVSLDEGLAQSAAWLDHLGIGPGSSDR